MIFRFAPEPDDETYDVVWNGSRTDGRAELLSDSLRHDRVRRAPASHFHAHCRQQVWSTIARNGTRGLTAPELVVLLSLSIQTINSALYNLRKTGRLQAEPEPVKSRYGKIIQRYRIQPVVK